MCAGKRKGDVEVGASGTGRKSFVAAPRHASLLHLKEQLYCEQSSGRGRISQMRRRDNNHPFFTRSCGTATTKELSTMEGINSLLQKYQRFHGETLPFSFVFLMSLEKLIVSFFSSFLLLFFYPDTQEIGDLFFLQELPRTRVFVILRWKRMMKGKKIERIVKRMETDSEVLLLLRERGKYERWWSWCLLIANGRKQTRASQCLPIIMYANIEICEFLQCGS